MTEHVMLPGSAREDLAVNGIGRYGDVEALAFAIVRALEDRDNGLIAEVDALRRQVSALATMADQAMSPALDVSALEAAIEHQPELHGVVEHLLESARGGRPVAPTTTALLLLTLPLTQSLARRHNQLEGEIKALRQDVMALCEEVANLNLAIVQDRGPKPAPAVDMNAIRAAVRVELAPLRQQVTALDRLEEIAALRSAVGELGERLTSVQPVGQSASLQDTIRADLARLIERLNMQSRAEQIVALREEVRAQLGNLDQAAELRSLRLMISTEVARLREQPPAAGSASAPTSPEVAGPRGSSTRRSRHRAGNVQGLLRTLRQRSDELDVKMAGLRQRGKQRAVVKTDDPNVAVSGPAALLLGVVDVLDDHDTP